MLSNNSEREFFIQRFGNYVEIGPCLVGKNLNLFTLRGFAKLDALATISAADVFDQEKNEFGTQRDLKRPHAVAAFEYAMESTVEPAEVDPRFFPEILMNVRDPRLVEIHDLDDPTALIDFDSTSGMEDLEGSLVGVRVLLTELEFPKPESGPPISRVDGNHRLWGADQALKEAYASGEGYEEEDFPTIAFSMLIGLDQDREAALFRDINAEQEGMNTSHLDQLRVRLANETLKEDEKTLPLWIAHGLAEKERAFYGKVHMGGSKAGVKEKFGEVPPVALATLRRTIDTQLKAAPATFARLRKDPETLLDIVDNYWKAVRDVFPQAWHDKRRYILLQAIGLGGFARFGGITMDRALHETQDLTQDGFLAFLKPVAEQIDLERGRWPGVAGAGGASYVAERLLEAASEEAVIIQTVKDKLAASVSDSERIAEADD